MSSARTTSTTSWGRARRSAAIFVLAGVALAGAATAAGAARTRAEDPKDTTTTTTLAPGAEQPTQSRLSTGKRINTAQDDAAGLDTTSSTADPEAPAKEQAGDDGDADSPERLSKLCGTTCPRRFVVPSVECSFFDKGSGMWNTVWNYDASSNVRIPVGKANYLAPGNPGQGQPTVFQRGFHRSVFITSAKGGLAWSVNGRAAKSPGRDCGHNPVPITGAGLSSIVTIFVVGALLGVVVLFLSRRNRRRNRPAQV